MISIIRQKFKEQFVSIIYYFIGLLAYAWMIIALFPYIENVKSAYLQQLPESFIKFFGGDALSIGKFEGFISIEFLGLFFILIVSFFVASSAGSTIAGAIEKKTMDFQLSQPISRTRLVISESFVTMIYTALLVFATALAILVLCKLYNTPISSIGLLAFAVTATALLWSIYGIAIFLSAILKSKITVAAAIVSLTMGFYVLSAMTTIIDKFSKFAKYSLFNDYVPQKLLETGTFNWHQIEIWGIIFAIGLIGSLLVFNQKDV